jgi:hypothetical protein
LQLHIPGDRTLVHSRTGRSLCQQHALQRVNHYPIAVGFYCPLEVKQGKAAHFGAPPFLRTLTTAIAAFNSTVALPQAKREGHAIVRRFVLREGS